MPRLLPGAPENPRLPGRRRRSPLRAVRQSLPQRLPRAGAARRTIPRLLPILPLARPMPSAAPALLPLPPSSSATRAFPSRVRRPPRPRQRPVRPVIRWRRYSFRLRICRPRMPSSPKRTSSPPMPRSSPALVRVVVAVRGRMPIAPLPIVVMSVQRKTLILLLRPMGRAIAPSGPVLRPVRAVAARA